MLRSRWTVAAGLLLAAGIGALLPDVGAAQQPAGLRLAQNPAGGDPAQVAAADTLILKFYDISDLTAGVYESKFDSAILTPSLLHSADNNHPVGGLFGGDGRDGESVPMGQISAEELVAWIREDLESVGPGMADVGSSNTIGEMLAVRHTAAAHQRIEEFLEQLRSTRPFGRPVEAVAHWVLIKPADLPTILKPGTQEADPQKLAGLPDDVLYARTSTRMITGQTTNLLAGRARTHIERQLPSVGQATAAYEPEVRRVLSGLLVRLGVLVRGSTATVAVLASAGDWDEPGKPVALRTTNAAVPLTLHEDPADEKNRDHVHTQPVGGAAVVAEVDRLQAVVMHLQTTAQLPVGKPTLVGGMTLEPATGTGIGKGDPRQLYLILEIRVPEGERVAK